jgi:hypothetical protein
LGKKSGDSPKWIKSDKIMDDRLPEMDKIGSTNGYSP